MRLEKIIDPRRWKKVTPDIHAPPSRLHGFALFSSDLWNSDREKQIEALGGPLEPMRGNAKQTHIIAKAWKNTIPEVKAVSSSTDFGSHCT